MTRNKFVSIDRFLPNFAGTERAQPEHTRELASMSAEASGSVIEEADEGVLIADATGYSRNEAIGKNCRYLQGSDSLQPEVGGMREAITKPKRIVMNCPFGQGYLFGAPVEPDAFKALVGTSFGQQSLKRAPCVHRVSAIMPNSPEASQVGQ